VGGHTIDDKEPKFGLSVMGVVHPGKVVRNSGAQAGDRVVLTKPIGTGIMATALRAGHETEESARDVIESMAALNRLACEAMVEVGVHAATDVTGFGIIGHLHEMAEASGLCARLCASAVPVFARAIEYAHAGVVPGRTADVIAWATGFASSSPGADADAWLPVLCDPQTSGGLLIAVDPERLAALIAALESRGVLAAVVGEFVAGEMGTVVIE
jgi:selenide,water dikinase